MEDFGAKTFYLAFIPGKAEIFHGAAAAASSFVGGTPGGNTPSGSSLLQMGGTPGGMMGGTPGQPTTQMISTLGGQ